MITVIGWYSLAAQARDSGTDSERGRVETAWGGWGTVYKALSGNDLWSQGGEWDRIGGWWSGGRAARPSVAEAIGAVWVMDVYPVDSRDVMSLDGSPSAE